MKRGYGKKAYFLHWLYGAVPVLLYLVGKTIYMNHNFAGITKAPGRFFLTVVLGGAAVGVLLLLFCKGLTYIKRIKVYGGLERILAWRYVYPCIWLLFTGVYLICFLAYYPGTFAYDMPAQTWQAYGRDTYNTYQPVLHTLLWAFFIRVGERLGDEALALVFYSVFQLVCVTTVSTAVVSAVYKITGNGYAFLITFLYYLLTPILHLMSFATTKDILFGCFFTMFMLALYQGMSDRSRKNCLAVVGFGLLSCLFRNNMIYVVVFALAVSVLLRCPVRLRLFLLVVISFYGCFTKVIFPTAGVEEGPKSEALSVPISQLSGVYTMYPELLNEEERETILAYMPDAGLFNMRLADPVKSSFNDNLLKADRKSFLKTYFQVLRKAPLECLCIFLDLNVNYWYPDALCPDEYANKEYIETTTEEVLSFFRVWPDSYFPAVRAYYGEIAEHRHRSMHLPGARYFYSLAFPLGTLYLCPYLAVQGKNRKCILPFALLTALFLTYLLGPVSNFRYLYPYYLSLPLYFGMAAKNGAEREKR